MEETNGQLLSRTPISIVKKSVAAYGEVSDLANDTWVLMNSGTLFELEMPYREFSAHMDDQFTLTIKGTRLS